MSKIQWKRSASLALMVIAGTQSWAMGQQRGTGVRQPSAAPTQAGGGSNPAMANAASALANNGKSKGQGSVAIGNIPNVVATVNGQPISKADLGKECVLRYGDQVLENMLNKSLIMQACQAQQITISEKEVDDEIGRIATKFNLNTAMYLKLIEDERGIDPAQYKSDIIWPMLALRMLARDKIQITRQDIDQAMENEFGPTVKVRMIAVKDLAKAQQLHQQAMADPASFKQLAKMHSEDAMSASVEGLLQPIRRFSGDEKFEKLAFGLQPDQISQIVNIADLHIFLQCVRHEPATPPNRDQIPIIEERIRQALMDEKLHGMAEQIFTTLRSQSNVAKVFGDPAQQQQNPGVAAFINRQQIPMSMLEEECVRRHGAKVLEGEINRKLLEQALAAERKQVTQQDIDLEIARAADFYGYIKPDKTPNVEAWLKVVLEEDGATLDLYVRDAVWPTVALKKLVEGKIQLTQEDLQRGFEASYGPEPKYWQSY